MTAGVRRPGAIRAAFADGSTPVELDPMVVMATDGGWQVDGVPVSLGLERHDPNHASLLSVGGGAGDAGFAHRAILLPGLRAGPAGSESLEVVVDGWRFEVLLEDDALAGLRERARRGRTSEGPSRPAEVRAMIPGRVAAVLIEGGQAVEAGDRLLVIEAMKMQNELRAPRAGIVSRVAVEPGRTVEAGELLAVID